MGLIPPVAVTLRSSRESNREMSQSRPPAAKTSLRIFENFLEIRKEYYRKILENCLTLTQK